MAFSREEPPEETKMGLFCWRNGILVIRHCGGSLVKAEQLAEMADRMGLHSCFLLLFWLGRGLSLTKLLPGSAWLSPGALPKLMLPGKGHNGCSRDMGSHLLHHIINTLYYERTGPTKVHLPLATPF